MHHDTPTALARRPLSRETTPGPPPADAAESTEAAQSPIRRAGLPRALELGLFRAALAVSALTGLAAALAVVVSISVVNDPGPPYYGGTTNMDKAPLALASPGLAALTALTATLTLGLTLNAWHRRLVELGRIADGGR